MSADDPRHGTVAGYNRIPCREECCRRAMATYKARWAWDKLNGRERIVSTLGTRRRIQALNALGWSNHEIAKRLGNDRSNLTRLIYGDTMTIALAAKVAAVYEELSMRLPTGNTQAIANVRNRAAKRGFAPPLAWDDIDNDPAPYSPPPREPGRPENSSDVVREFDWLVSCGESAEMAAERVGVALSTIDRYRLRLAEREVA